MDPLAHLSLRRENSTSTRTISRRNADLYRLFRTSDYFARRSISALEPLYFSPEKESHVGIPDHPGEEGRRSRRHPARSARGLRGDAEADLVRRLGEANVVGPSLVAEIGASITGHILFNPVTLPAAARGGFFLGPAPLAGLSDHQNRGIGQRLGEQALEACRGLECDAVFVLGQPPYYSRFGFRPASQYGLNYADRGPDPSSMAIEFRAGAPFELSASVNHHPDFS
jgi:putative acetyltransferase